MYRCSDSQTFRWVLLPWRLQTLHNLLALCYTLDFLVVALCEVVHLSCGVPFIYIVRFSGVEMGQEWGWAPLQAGFKPPVASATDRAKAVLPSLPWLSVCDVHVCLLLVLHEPFVLNMYFSIYLLSCISWFVLLWVLHLLHELSFFLLLNLYMSSDVICNSSHAP